MTIWDAVWLNDEVDLLVWRIQLLRGEVDHVLVVEGDRTFTGQKKQSSFQAHEFRIRSLGADVRHVVVPLDPGAKSAWDRENQQRRGMAKALRDLAEPGDTVIVCDVDEVPRPSTVRRLGKSLDRPVRLHMMHANYFANWVHDEPWRNSAWAFCLGQERDHQMLRVHLGEPHSDWDGYVEEFVPNAGWHLSFMGGEHAVRRKWEAYSHQENNTPIDLRPGHLERCFTYGVHFTGYTLLKKLPVVEPELETLSLVQPNFFRFEPPPPPSLARAVQTWTWLRRKRWVPDALRRAVDGSDQLLALGRPILLPIGAAASARRRFRRRDRWPAEREWLFPRA